MATPSILEKYITNPIKDSIVEIHSLIPDSILFGSLFLYFLTHNLSFGVFAIFLIELVLSHRFLSWFISQTVGPSRPPSSFACRAGFKTPQYQYERIFSHDIYPSYSIFSVTAIATYLGLATNSFHETLEEMGKEWGARSAVAYAFIFLFLIAFLIARVSLCESMNELIIATILAVIVGGIFFYINRTIFGMESINFLGLPYLVKKDEKGSSIYVCGPTL